MFSCRPIHIIAGPTNIQMRPNMIYTISLTNCLRYLGVQPRLDVGVTGFRLLFSSVADPLARVISKGI